MDHILLPTKHHLKNVNYLYSACLNPTNVVLVIVLVIALVITHRSTLAVSIWPLPIIILKTITKTTLVGFGHALEIILIFKIHLGWEKDIQVDRI